MEQAFFYQVFIFLFGLIVGSFLNCLIYRLEQNKTKSLLKGRSFCPCCKHSLQWFDLIPLLSFFLLKGKCRYCHKTISFQYPVVELLTALTFLSLSFKEGVGLKGLIIFFTWACLIVIFVYDLKHYIIPDKVLIPLFSFILLLKVLNFENSKMLGLDFLFAFLVALFFFLIWFFSKGKAMGFGDVKLVFPLMLLLGWPLGVVGLFIAFLSGSLIGLVLMALGKKKMSSQVPFGPFLIAGAFVAFLWGNIIWQWYLHLINLS